MVANVEQLKQEISEYYLDDFKKELGWLKSLALLPIEKKVKNLISGTTDLPKTFDAVQEFGWWKDIISFVSPKVANQIFDFMKQKRLEIEQRKTKEELESLKNQILGIRPQGDEEHANQHQQAEPDGQEPGVDKTAASTAQAPSRSQHDELDAPQTADGSLNPIAMGAGVSTLGVGGVLVLDRLNRSREVRNMAETIDASKMKYTIEQAIFALKSQHQALAGAGRLSSKQLESMDKHIAKLSEGLESMDDDGIALIKLWKTLDGKLPRSLLQSTALDPSTLAKIEKLAPEFFGKTSDEIATFLTSKGIAQLPDELLKSLMQAESVAELQGMTKVLRHGSKANRILQTLAGAMLIDVACLGLDVWMYLETKKEAELIAKVNEIRAKNKTNQAYTQLAIGLASVAVEAAIIAYAVSAGTAVGGPFGTVVGLAVGGISAAASMGVDSLYFDVHDFYTQNQEDFLRQSRGKLKHAILQGIHNQQEGNVSLNEKVHHSIAHLFSVEGKDAKEQSLRDACFSMLFLEEVGIGEFKDDSDLLAYLHSGQKKADFLSALPPESAKSFIDKWETITARINLRLEYIETQLQKPEMIDSIKRHQGMQSLTQLFTLSKLYAYQGKQGWKADLSSEDKLAITKSAFFADFPAEKLKKFEQLGVENPALFQEIVKTASLDALLRADEEDDRYTQNVQLVLKYQEWLALRQSYEEAVYLEIPDVHKNVNFVEQLLYADFDLQQVTYPSFDTDGAIDLVQQGLERRGMMEISDDPMQNVLYQLAKQLYGYAGQNDQEALMQFFSENGETYGLYYDNQRKINEDWAVDEGIGTLDLGEYSEEEIPQIVDAFVEQQTDARFSFGFSWRKMIATSNPALMLMHLFSHEEKSIIDTPTESIDPALQAEWKQQLGTLLLQELQLRTKENKTKIKNQISHFVQTHAQDGKYLELPYYLLIEARKAGFGDLQRQFFAWKDGRLQMLGLQSELTIGSGLAEERAYFTQARETFTTQEQRYIDRVEQAHQRLESLRSIEGNGTKEDELDLPREVELLISQKYKEREQLKSELLLRDASTALHPHMQQRYESFYQYFEQLYQGILLQLMTFKVSNDMDDFAYYQGALHQGQQLFFDEKGVLKQGEHPILNNQAFRSWYERQIQVFRIGSKTIQQLWQSPVREEQAVALRASQLMMRKVLELGMFSRDQDNQKMGIRRGNLVVSEHSPELEFVGKSHPILSKTFDQEVQSELQKLSIEPILIEGKQEFDKYHKAIAICKLKPQEQDTIAFTKLLQAQIEKTQSEIVWQGKRGDIRYLPEKSALKSWGNAVVFEQKGEQFYLKGLEVGLSLSELVWLANFRNWCVRTYKGKTLSLEREFWSRTVAWYPSFVVDGTVLLDRTTLNSYCPVCKDDALVKKIATWLNSQL